jgi:hypothetical protein
MRPAALAILFVACERPPVMEHNPDVLWFRSRDPVSTAIAKQIVNEARHDGWAGPMYVMMPSATRGSHLVGHQRIRLGEYETVDGQFRIVDPADDHAMGCVTVRQALESLRAWTRRFDVQWDVHLGPSRWRVPRNASAVEYAACQNASAADEAAIERRYADRPR